MEITLHYIFGKNNKKVYYDVNVDYDIIADYFEENGGILPKFLNDLIDYSKLEDNSFFVDWLTEKFKAEAEENYNEECMETLDGVTDSVFNKITNTPGKSPFDSEFVRSICKEYADDFNIPLNELVSSVTLKLYNSDEGEQ